MKSDPLSRARHAESQMQEHRDALARLGQERVDAIRDALAAGLSQADVARELGVSRQVITKLLRTR